MIREVIKWQKFLAILHVRWSLVCLCVFVFDVSTPKMSHIHSSVSLLAVLEVQFNALFAKQKNESEYIKSFTLHKIHLKCPNVFIESRAWFMNESIDTFVQHKHSVPYISLRVFLFFFFYSSYQNLIALIDDDVDDTHAQGIGNMYFMEIYLRATQLVTHMNCMTLRWICFRCCRYRFCRRRRRRRCYCCCRVLTAVWYDADGNHLVTHKLHRTPALIQLG